MNNKGRIEQLYCFHYTASNEFFTIENGWNKISIEQEFQRMGCPNNNWKLSTLNKNYELCKTYPRCLFLPNSVDDYIIRGSAKFRSKSRLPVLSYLYTNKVSVYLFVFVEKLITKINILILGFNLSLCTTIVRF